MGILQIAVVGEVLPLRSCSLHLTERLKKSVGLSGELATRSGSSKNLRLY
jgi:hypothetical protein